MRKTGRRLGLIAILLVAPVPAGSSVTRGPGEPDFEGATREATAILRDYLRIDTSNPPGNEHRAALFLKGVFDRERIACQIIDHGDGRASLVARLPGSGRERPLLLLSHSDVVPAEADRWSVPPFAGELRDGKVWGRGATDMKGTAVCHLMTMLLLSRSDTVLDRDVLFLATADEEVGSHNGLRWILENRREILRGAEFALTEGASISIRDGRTEAWNVAATEKAVLWLRLTASGPTGHAAFPDPDGSIPRLARAVQRLSEYHPEPRLIHAVDHYFRHLAETTAAPLRDDLANPSEALRDPLRAARLLADPVRAACLRPTIGVTGLSAGRAGSLNMIPAEASATIDCRLLPGDDPVRFVSTLQEVVDDEKCRFEVIASSRSYESPTDTGLFRAIERARDRFEPGVPVWAPPLLSSSDANLLREAGIVAYGFEPFRLTEADDRGHMDDEFLSIENLALGIKVTYEVVAHMAARRP